MKSVLKKFILLFGLEFITPLPYRNVELLSGEYIPNQQHQRVQVLNQKIPAPPVSAQYQTETFVTPTTPLTGHHQQIAVPNLSAYKPKDSNQRWITHNNVPQQILPHIVQKPRPINQVTIPQQHILTVKSPDILKFPTPDQYQSPQQLNRHQTRTKQTPNSFNYATPVQYHSPRQQQKIIAENTPNYLNNALPVQYQSPQRQEQHEFKKIVNTGRPSFQTEQQQLLGSPQRIWAHKTTYLDAPSNAGEIKTVNENLSTTDINQNRIKRLYNHLSNQVTKDNVAPDYNINQLLYNAPSIRDALVPPRGVGKKRYVVIQADGSIEYVDKLDTVIEKYPDYILVRPKNQNNEKGSTFNSRSETKTFGVPIKSGYTAPRVNPPSPVNDDTPNQRSPSSDLYPGNATDLKTLPLLVEAVPKPTIPEPSKYVQADAKSNQVLKSDLYPIPKIPDSTQEPKWQQDQSIVKTSQIFGAGSQSKNDLNWLGQDQSIVQPPESSEVISQSKNYSSEPEKADSKENDSEEEATSTQTVTESNANTYATSRNEDANHILNESEKSVQNTGTSTEDDSDDSESKSESKTISGVSKIASSEINDPDKNDKALLVKSAMVSQEVEEKKEVQSPKKPFNWFTTSDPDFWRKLLGDDPEAVVYFFQAPSKNDKSVPLDSECNEEISP